MVDEEVKAPEGSVCPAHNRCQGQELEHLQEALGVRVTAASVLLMGGQEGAWQ